MRAEIGALSVLLILTRISHGGQVCGGGGDVRRRAERIEPARPPPERITAAEEADHQAAVRSRFNALSADNT